MKSYTNLEQSKKLERFLPLESADMVLLHEEPYETSDSKFDGLHQALCIPFNKYDKSWRQKYKNISYFPCWSLVALLKIIRSACNYELLSIEENKIFGVCKLEISPCRFLTEIYDNELDVCYEMILKLHKQKFL